MCLSKPKAPTIQAPPAVAAPPPAPVPVPSETSALTAEAQRKQRLQQGRGAASLIKTPLGLTGTGADLQSTLLGGKTKLGA